jgi:hypothetical protein
MSSLWGKGYKVTLTHHVGPGVVVAEMVEHVT